MSVRRGMTRSSRKLGNGVVPPLVSARLVRRIDRWIVVVLNRGDQQRGRSAGSPLWQPTNLTANQFRRMAINQVLSFAQADTDVHKFQDQLITVRKHSIVRTQSFLGLRLGVRQKLADWFKPGHRGHRNKTEMSNPRRLKTITSGGMRDGRRVSRSPS